MPVEKARSDQHRFPLWPTAAAVAISVLAAVAIVLLSWQLQHRFADLREKQVQLSEYHSRTMLYDEALTMSARMAAATGDLAYKQRYDTFDAALGALIKQTQNALRAPEVRQFIEQTDRANRKLVEIERRALSLVGEGRLTEASSLLASEEYSRLKAIYADGVDKTASWLKGAIESQVRHLNLLTAGLEIASGVIVLVLLWAWYFAVRAGRRWSEERLRSEADLNNSRDQLELRVKERTADLWSANERLGTGTRALTQERDFSTALIDSLPSFFALLDEGGRLIRWNENLPALTGLSDEQLRGVDALTLIVESDHDLVRTKIQETFSMGAASVEFGMRTYAGDVRSIRWNGRRITSEGHPALLAVGMDVTEEREAQMRLHMSEERFRTVSDAAQDAIITINSAAKVTYWNRAAERILGYSAEEAIGKPVHEWLTPARYREKAVTGMREFVATGRGAVLGKTLELAALNKDGLEIPIELSIAAMQLGTDWHAVAIMRDITERKRAREQMAHMARHDILTGLANRAVFVEALQQEMVSARRSGKGFAVLYLDLDHFKDVNDTLGHPIGDLLLQAVAERLRASIRETDTVARFGGDEFAVLETDMSDPAEAAVLADKILKVISDPLSIEGNEIRSGTSVGIAVYGPNSPEPEALLSHADEALYRAKSADRGTYRFFTDTMDKEVRSRVMIKAELREAIELWSTHSFLPAAGQYRHEPHHRARSAGSLATSKTRSDRARRIHSGGGEERADRGARALGAT